MMRISYQSHFDQLPKELTVVERQVPFATSLALNETANEIRSAIRMTMEQVFDRPTPYTLRSLWVERARKGDLRARVTFRESAGKGLSAHKYLSPQVEGGPRSQKRSEKAFDRVGLPMGHYVPAGGARRDAYGNMSRGQIVQLLSYFEAFGEQGYRANSTAESRAKSARNRKRKGGYKKIGGRVYFISRGRGSMSGNREQHLPAGIWEKTGIHGVEVKPIVLAVGTPVYSPRLPFYERAEEVFAETFDANYATALDRALATAR